MPPYEYHLICNCAYTVRVSVTGSSGPLLGAAALATAPSMLTGGSVLIVHNDTAL